MLDGLQEKIGEIGEDVKEFISEKPITSALIGVGVAGVGVGLGAVAISRAKSKKRITTKTKRRSSKGRKRDRRFISKQKHERAYQKRRKKLGKKTYGKRYKTSSTKVKRTGKTYYTKKGQPYKILASGKARFIKKSKGGRR